MQTAASRGTPFILQNAATSGNGNVLALPPNMREHRITINGSAGIGAGAVQPETADDPNFAGTWQAIGSPVTVPVSGEVGVAFTGVFQFIRARISTPVVGGTVTVSHIGQSVN